MVQQGSLLYIPGTSNFNRQLCMHTYSHTAAPVHEWFDIHGFSAIKCKMYACACVCGCASVCIAVVFINQSRSAGRVIYGFAYSVLDKPRQNLTDAMARKQVSLTNLSHGYREVGMAGGCGGRGAWGEMKSNN